MVRVRAALLVVVAFFLGALAAGGIGVRVIREVRAEADATSLPAANVSSTTIPAAPPAAIYQVDPHETILASSALVPTSIELGDDGLAIGYDLVTMAPHLGVEPVASVGGFGFVDVVDPADLDHVYPSRWVLDTAGGPVEGGPAGPAVRFARFEVPEGLSLGDVEGATIVEALVPLALDVTFTLSQDAPVVEVHPGSRWSSSTSSSRARRPSCRSASMPREVHRWASRDTAPDGVRPSSRRRAGHAST
jgi:hypothetical protein